MDDGQKQTINHIYHTLRDMLTHNPALWITNTTPDIKHMIWYLETNFPKDMLEHEMGDRGFLTYSEHMQDDLEPIEGDEDA